MDKETIEYLQFRAMRTKELKEKIRKEKEQLQKKDSTSTSKNHNKTELKQTKNK